MAITDTYNKLCEVVGASTSITTISTEMPTQLNDPDLPYAIVRVGPAGWNAHAVGLYRQVRTYYIDVYVQPLAQGMGIDEGYRACFGPLNNVGDTLIRNTSLDNTVDEIRQPIPDQGIMPMDWAGITYHGFRYSLDVTEKTT